MVLCALSLGCAHAGVRADSDGEDEQLLRLRQDNASLRKRVQLLEDRVLQLERASSRRLAQGLPAGRELPIVKLGGPDSATTDGSTRVDEPSAPAPRLRLRDSVSLEPIPQSSPDPAGSGPEPEPSIARPERQPEASAPAPAPPADKATAGRSFRLVGSELIELTRSKRRKRPDRPRRGRKGRAILAEYDAAMGVYRGGQLRAAEIAFDHFARSYPKHDYADNALYWKGEAAYDQAHYADALAAFTEVVKRYGGGNKAPDALLKIGLCYGRLGDPANARDVLARLVAAYPDANATRIARQKPAELEDG
jgi:tol-pal system protein YbgF